jgi:hypothetical protein
MVATVETVGRGRIYFLPQDQDLERREVQGGHGEEPDPLHELSQSEDLHAGQRPLPQKQDSDGGIEEGEEFSVLDWLENSPNLNPIENILTLFS